jgi:hypothetical protein
MTTTPLDPAAIQEIRDRLAGATPGPWSPVTTGRWDHSNYVCREDLLGVAMQYALVWQAGDAEFIAHAPDDITALLAEVDRLVAELAAAQETSWKNTLAYAATALEGSSDNGDQYAAQQIRDRLADLAGDG